MWLPYLARLSLWNWTYLYLVSWYNQTDQIIQVTRFQIISKYESRILSYYASCGKTYYWKRHCSLYQERIWKEICSFVSLYCWQRLWMFYNPRIWPFHLHQRRSIWNIIVQKWSDSVKKQTYFWKFFLLFSRIIIQQSIKKSSMNVDDNTTLIFVILFLCMGTYSFIYLCVYFIELINVRIQVNEISPIMAT